MVRKTKKRPKLTKLEKYMLKALKEAEMVIKLQSDGCCLISVLNAIAKAEGKYESK